MKLYKVKKSNIDNRGLYANKNIKNGTKIIQYKGKIITNRKSEEDPKFSTTGGTSDARFIKKISPCLEFGLVNKTMHKVDECVSVTDLRKLTNIYKNILIEYFK